MSKIILILTLIISNLFVLNTSQAYTVKGGNKSQTIKLVESFDKYMQDKHQLSIKNDDIVILNMNTKQIVKNFRPKLNRDVYISLTKSSGYYLGSKNIIIINTDYTKDKQSHALIHELTHKFQHLECQKNNLLFSLRDKGMLEGIADYLASEFLHENLPATNYGISMRDMLTHENFRKLLDRHGCKKIYAQCRFYARSHYKNYNKLY